MAPRNNGKTKPTRRRVRIMEELDPDDSNTLPLDDLDAEGVENENDPQTQQIDNLLEELDQSTPVTINVYRQPGNGHSRMQWLTCMDAADYPSTSMLMQALQSKVGGGDLRLMFRNSKKMIRNILVSVAKPEGAELKTGQLMPAAAPVPAVSPQLEQLLTRMLDRLDSRPEVDPMAQMSAMLMMLTKAKDFVAPAAPAAPVKDPYVEITRILRLKNELEDTAPSRGTTMTDVVFQLLKGIGPQLAPMLAAAAQGAGQPMLQANGVAGMITPQLSMAPMPGPVPAQDPGAAAPAAAPAPAAAVPAEIAMLIQAASMNIDPETMVDLALNVLPKDQAQFTYVMQNREVFFGGIIQQNPQLEPLRPWFERLLDAVISALTEENGEADTPPDATGTGAKVTQIRAG